MTQSSEITLGDVAEFIRGINFKPNDVVPLGTEGSVGCMRTKNVQDELDCSDVWAVPKEFVRREEQMLAEGDILVSSANSWNLVGKCSWIPKLEQPSSFGGFVSVLRGKPNKVEPRFLYRWFSWDYTQALLRSFGQKTTNISNLNIERCLNMKLTLPPLPEQRRVAAILDQADAVRAKRREALAQLDSLTQSIFIAMFGDPNLNDKGWTVVSLGSICQSIWDIDHKMPKSVDSGLPFISAKDLVENGKIAFDEVKLISREDFERLAKKGMPTKGDIIYSRIGANLGKARMVRVDFPFLASYSCCTIRPDEKQVCCHYLCHLLDSPYLLKQAHRGVRAIAVPDLGMGEIKNFQIILPPLEQQYEFSKRLGVIEGLRKQHLDSQLRLDDAFASLQHRAFRGQL